MVTVRVDMEKKRMWALVWNRRNTMKIPTRNTTGVGCKPFTFILNVFIVWDLYFVIVQLSETFFFTGISTIGKLSNRIVSFNLVNKSRKY